MKTFLMATARGVVAMIITMGVFACGGPDDALNSPEETQVQTESEALTATRWCEDIRIEQVQYQFCGFQDGPLDDSPVFVRCTRTCTTERYVTFPAGIGGERVCESGETTCEPWSCPSCL